MAISTFISSDTMTLRLMKCVTFSQHTACQTASHRLAIILADCWMSLSVEVTCRLRALISSMSDSLIIIFCVGQSRWSVKPRSMSRHRIVHRSASTPLTSDQPSSLLRDAGAWSSIDVNDLAQLYNTELTSILDRLVPVRTIKCR